MLVGISQSILHIFALRPARCKALSHFVVDDIMVGNSSLSIPSFTQLPNGELRLRMILTEPFGFGLVIMPFTLAVAGICSRGTGP